MGINTDLNVDPYYDDFAESKQFNRVLFKPAKAVQARELTQLQTILQESLVPTDWRDTKNDSNTYITTAKRLRSMTCQHVGNKTSIGKY